MLPLFSSFHYAHKNMFHHRNGGGMRWLLAVAATAAMLTCAEGGLVKVGGKAGWRANVNYTQWAAHRHFYVGDWLYFVFDKRYYNVLEVNKSNYEECRDVEFIHNITKGGRDVFNLTESRSYYFLSSGGYCFHGMKLSIHVDPSPPPPPLPPPPPSSSSDHNHTLLVFFFVVFSSSFTFLFKLL